MISEGHGFRLVKFRSTEPDTTISSKMPPAMPPGTDRDTDSTVLTTAMRRMDGRTRHRRSTSKTGRITWIPASARHAVKRWVGQVGYPTMWSKLHDPNPNPLHEISVPCRDLMFSPLFFVSRDQILSRLFLANKPSPAQGRTTEMVFGVQRKDS